MSNKKELTVYQEQNYSISKNKIGDLLIIISKYTLPAKNPEILYDGGDHAMLYHDDKTIIILDFINPEIRQELINAKMVLIIEGSEENNGPTIESEYICPIIKTEKLPIPKDKIITPKQIDKQLNTK